MAKKVTKKSRKPTIGRVTTSDFSKQRELVVVMKPAVELRAARPEVESASGADIDSLKDLIASEGITLRPLFGVSEDKLKARAAEMTARTGTDLPDLSVYYHVDAPDDRRDQLARKLRKLDTVEAAYVKPAAEPAQVALNEMPPMLDEAPVATPDFTSRQAYLGRAPIGIDAEYAWSLPGGRGQGVDVIDIEWGWNFTHEDLVDNQGGVISGTNSTANDHGTAVIGEIGGDSNTLGITGISPDAHVRAVSLTTHGTAEAIHMAADQLEAGDIILLEVHRAGPQYTAGDWSRFGFIAIEWWPDDFDAIRYAVNKGIIVVEAAGNGGQDLDDPIYDANPGAPLGPFPATWRNPFNSANPNSGAVIVGAGMPPRGTHGRNAQPDWGDAYADRGRCFFSNYGSRIDAQGWGWEVTTTGYGDLQGGSDRNQWYTDQFSGTSSASPIVVGAIACMQGVLRARGKPPLTSDEARTALRASGSPQQNGPAFPFAIDMSGTGYPQNHPARPQTQRIGTRPNLRQLIPAVVTHEVGSYRVLMISGYGGAGGNQIGFVYLYDPSGRYIGYVGVIKDGTPLPSNVQWPNGILNIYFHEAELVAMLDTLRNERPVFVRYHTKLKWGSIGTNREPVGEEETPAAP